MTSATPDAAPAAQTLGLFQAARLRAVTAAPYLTRAIMALQPVVVEPRFDDAGLPVADPEFRSFPTDRRWRVHLDPGTAAGTPAEMLAWWLIHHVSHLVRGHGDRSPLYRLAGVEARHWGWAADAEVNDDLVAIPLAGPPGHLLPATLGMPSGRLAEQYLSTIEVLDESSGSRLAARLPIERCGEARDGTLPDDPTTQSSGAAGLSALEARFLERSLARDLQHGSPSTIPLGWLRWAGEVLGGSIDWRRRLAGLVRRAALTTAGRTDFSHARISRRQQPGSRVVLAAMVRPRPVLAVVVDTSASVGKERLGRLVGEILPVLRTHGSRDGWVSVIPCDAVAHPVQRVRLPEELRLVGGGGTDLQAGIAAALDLRPRPDVIVCLTDGQTPWPERRPPVPLVVGVLGDAPAPPWSLAVRIPPEEVP